jgi:hypothetical protein
VDDTGNTRVLWSELPTDFSLPSIYHRVYASDLAGSSPQLILQRPILFSETGFQFAASMAGEHLLLTWSSPDLDPTRHCVSAQRFRFDAFPVDPVALTVRCAPLTNPNPNLPELFELDLQQDGSRAWLATSTSKPTDPADAVLYTLTFPGSGMQLTPIATIPASQSPRDLKLTRTPVGITTIYSRSGEPPIYRRVFLRPLYLDVKGRAVRH